MEEEGILSLVYAVIAKILLYNRLAEQALASIGLFPLIGENYRLLFGAGAKKARMAAG